MTIGAVHGTVRVWLRLEGLMAFLHCARPARFELLRTINLLTTSRCARTFDLVS
jgi:hypothetical protein